MGTIEGSTDNETLVKITRQQKKVGRQEQEVKMQKIQVNQETLKQSRAINREKAS